LRPYRARIWASPLLKSFGNRDIDAKRNKQGIVVKDKGLTEFNSFDGHLQVNGSTIKLTFLVRIDPAGEVEFDFGTIALTSETKFIMDFWHNTGAKVKCYSLSGKSADEIEFNTDNLYFNSIGHSSSKESGSCMSPKGGCSRAKFRRKLSEPVSMPIIRMHVKGFRNFRQLKSKCNLGTITMVGKSSIEEPDMITGYIEVFPDNEPSDLSAWRTESDKLLEHVRRVMSFASAAVLQVPIIEYFSDNSLEIHALSQVSQTSASMRIIHFLNQQPVFDSVVLSFFNPPIKVKNLFFAIEWFSMSSTYNEVRLVNAMTVLENIIASNFLDKDVMIQPPKVFKKTRKILRKVIKKCVEKWGPEEAEKAEEVLLELNERLADLNRRSIFKKFKILVDRWSIPLNGISIDDFKRAKRARDLIVHQGHYYEEEQGETVDLWQHVTVVREIVVRILLTAIGYKGSYCSYLGGYHEGQFPPQEDENAY